MIDPIPLNTVRTRDRVILKALLAWAKSRFSELVDANYSDQAYEITKQLNSTIYTDRSAWISTEDAQLIEQNSLLYKRIGTQYMKCILPKKVFERYGALSFKLNDAGTVVYIDFNPVEFAVCTNDSPPLLSCTMFVVSKTDIIKACKKHESHMGPNHVDAMPLLRQNLNDLLDEDDNYWIDELFLRNCDKPEVVKFKEVQAALQTRKAENRREVIEALQSSNDDQIAKAAICIYDIVNKSYKTDPHKVIKLKRTPKGVTSVYGFSMSFAIQDVNIDMDILAEVVRRVIQNDIEREIRVIQDNAQGIILCTTNASEKPTLEGVTVFWTSEGQLDYTFDKYAASSLSYEICQKIIDEVKATILAETTQA